LRPSDECHKKPPELIALKRGEEKGNPRNDKVRAVKKNRRGEKRGTREKTANKANSFIKDNSEKGTPKTASKGGRTEPEGNHDSLPGRRRLAFSGTHKRPTGETIGV